MISLFSRKAESAAIFGFIAFVLFFITPVTAAEDGAAVNWNITFNQMPSAQLGNDAHISELSWWVLFCIGFLLFILSVRWTLEQGADILAAISSIVFLFLSITGFFIQQWSYELISVQLNETAKLMMLPVVYTHPAWVVLITLMMFVLGIVNLYRIYINSIVKAADTAEE